MAMTPQDVVALAKRVPSPRSLLQPPLASAPMEFKLYFDC